MSVYREKRVFKWFGICRDGEQGLKTVNAFKSIENYPDSRMIEHVHPKIVRYIYCC